MRKVGGSPATWGGYGPAAMICRSGGSVRGSAMALCVVATSWYCATSSSGP